MYRKIFTPQEAKELQCPLHVNKKCEAKKCMAWTVYKIPTDTEFREYGFCKLIER